MKLLFILLISVLGSMTTQAHDLTNQRQRCQALENSKILIDLLGENLEAPRLKRNVLCIGNAKVSVWGNTTHFTYNKNNTFNNDVGLELTFSKFSYDFKGIFLYGHTQDSDGYLGSLPYELSMDDSRSLVLLKLGIPKKSYTSKGEHEVRWDRFEVDNFSIFIQYRDEAKRNTRTDSKIDRITITLNT